MIRHLFSAILLLIVCLFQGCASDVASDGGRMRMGIHDPIERHSRRSWKWPFQRKEKSRPAPVRAPEGDGTLPEYQTPEGMEPG